METPGSISQTGSIKAGAYDLYAGQGASLNNLGGGSGANQWEGGLLTLTGVNNLSLGAEPELDRSVFASGLSRESVAELGKFARKEWARIFPRIVSRATQLYEADVQHHRSGQRMRIGMFFYKGPDPAGHAPAPTAPNALPSAPTRSERPTP